MQLLWCPDAALPGAVAAAAQQYVQVHQDLAA
jgi:hypothetical protein